MNVRLLRRIAKVIQEKPKQFDMRYWHIDQIAARKSVDHRDGHAAALCDIPKVRQISCGTTHCIAGWAQALSPKRDCHVNAEVDAMRLLELSPEQCDRLFYVGGVLLTLGWPKEFRGRKVLSNPTAKQAAARIEHFIKTKGAE